MFYSSHSIGSKLQPVRKNPQQCPVTYRRQDLRTTRAAGLRAGESQRSSFASEYLQHPAGLPLTSQPPRRLTKMREPATVNSTVSHKSCLSATQTPGFKSCSPLSAACKPCKSAHISALWFPGYHRKEFYLSALAFVYATYTITQHITSSTFRNDVWHHYYGSLWTDT